MSTTQGDNRRKRRREEEPARHPKSLGATPDQKDTADANRGSSSSTSASETSLALENALRQFDQFYNEYRRAHDEYCAAIRKEKGRVSAQQSSLSVDSALSLQRIADEKKPHKERQQKDKLIEERVSERFEQTARDCREALDRANSGPDRWNALKLQRSRKHLAKREAERALFDPEEADAAALTPAGEVVKAKFNALLEKAKEKAMLGLAAHETVFIDKIKKIIAKQEGLNNTMDEAKVGKKVDESEVDPLAKSHVLSTPSAKDVFEDLKGKRIDYH